MWWGFGKFLRKKLKEIEKLIGLRPMFQKLIIQLIMQHDRN